MMHEACLFSITKCGIKMSSIYHSLMKNAKLYHLNIYLFQKCVLTQILEHLNSVDVQAHLPHLDQLPDFVLIRFLNHVVYS